MTVSALVKEAALSSFSHAVTAHLSKDLKPKARDQRPDGTATVISLSTYQTLTALTLEMVLAEEEGLAFLEHGADRLFSHLSAGPGRGREPTVRALRGAWSRAMKAARHALSEATHVEGD